MPTVIVDAKEIERFRLYVETILTDRMIETAGSASLLTVRDNMAREVAEKILTDSRFFRTYELPVPRSIHVRIDVVVLSLEDWRNMMMAQFRKGVEHAQGGGSRDPFYFLP